MQRKKRIVLSEQETSKKYGVRQAGYKLEDERWPAATVTDLI